MNLMTSKPQSKQENSYGGVSSKPTQITFEQVVLGAVSKLEQRVDMEVYPYNLWYMSDFYNQYSVGVDLFVDTIKGFRDSLCNALILYPI
jgi:hypothetical protein